MIQTFLSWICSSIIENTDNSIQNIYTFIGIWITIISILLWFILTIASYLTNTTSAKLKTDNLWWKLDLKKYHELQDEIFKIKEDLSKNFVFFFILIIILILVYLIMILFVRDILKVLWLFILLFVLMIIFLKVFMKIKYLTDKNLELQRIINSNEKNIS